MNKTLKRPFVIIYALFIFVVIIIVVIIVV